MRGNEIVGIGRLADIPARRRYPRCSLGRIRKAEECEQIALANVEEKVMPPPVGHLYVPHHRHAQDVAVKINRPCHVAADQGEMVYPPKLKPWILQSLLCAHIALSCLAAWLFILFQTPESFLARRLAKNTRPIFIKLPSMPEPASSRCPVAVYQEALIELIQARTANLRHREIDLAPQNTDRLAHPRNSAGCRAIERRSPAKNEARAQRQRDQDIRATPHPAVQHNRHPVADRLPDRRQRFERGGSPVELPPAMIRHDDSVDADIRGAAGVVGMQNAFDDQMARPQFAELLEVFPGR